MDVVDLLVREPAVVLEDVVVLESGGGGDLLGVAEDVAEVLVG